MNTLYLGCRKISWAALVGFVLSAAVPMSVLAQPQDVWTLEDSIQRVLEIAPEIRAAQAMISARQGALQQAGAWPNPQIELRADDRIGKDEGTGGTSFTRFAFSQPLPLSGRLGQQRAIARAELEAARSARQYQHLRLETQVAQRYHSLQLMMESLRVAEQRLQLADEFQNIGHRREQAGELSRLERLRLDLIRESAQQMLDKAEGGTNEALSRFRAYLGLTSAAIPKLMPLEPFASMPVLEQLQTGLSEHPALLAARHRLDAARSGVSLVRAERLPDPTLRLFREQDFLNGRRQDVTGIEVVVTAPLWDRKAGRLSEAHAQVEQTQSKLQMLERDLASSMQQNYLHLNHLVEQAAHFLVRVLEPAEKVFVLTRKAYVSGELEILSLIDANNTYFDAHERYLELLQEAWLEAAELRLTAGRALVTTEQDTHHE